MSQNGSLKRTKLNAVDLNRLQNLSMIASRLALAGRVGQSHNGSRDLYETLGYPSEIKSADLISQWKRQGIARAVVDRPVKATWQGDLYITESTEEDETKLEIAYKQLDKKIRLKEKMMRVDRLACLGEYAVLLLGFDDSSQQTWSQPVTEGERKLMYARPVSKGNIDIDAYETDPSNPRFGLPRIYSITLENPDGSESTKTRELKVHYSRIIHVAYDLLENDVEGEPVMESVYNRLKDLEKMVGGSAEMFWRGARPGYFGSAKEDYSVDTKTQEDLKEQLDEYEHNLRRFLLAEGIDIKNLDQQISDPKGHVMVQLQMISAATGIPLRILIGSERGELASTQDQKNWKEFIQHRRTEQVETSIVRPFVDRLIEYGVLPGIKDEEEGYGVAWSDLFAIGEKEKSEIGKSRAEALARYTQNPMTEAAVPLEGFLRYFMQMEEDHVNQLLELRDSELEGMMREEAELEQEQEEFEQQEPEEGGDE